MKNTSKILRFLTLSIAAAGVVMISGHFVEADAQARDPFSKPGWARTKEVRTGTPGSGATVKKGPAPINPVGVPAIEQRIEYYKRLRESAALNGQPLPKVTSVLTLNEMAVTGIFRTPRGYAAMVEATPIKLSYTIYPGEKFFDGQLVAVEENRLVFRRVSKMNNGKFVASVENKTLRQYTTQETVQGTAPVQTQTDGKPPETVTAYQPAPAADGAKPPTAAQIISPLDEMNKQMPETDAEKAKAKSKSKKKTVKVAKSN